MSTTAKEKKIRVAIQGFGGSFHDQAAREYFNGQELELVCCASFEDLFDQIDADQADVAVMAIENTVAGSLLPNYALLRQSGYQIFGEVYLRISQHVMALPDQSLQDLSEVHSHYMAIEQTRKFFRQYRHIKLIESEDTALSAKRIADEQLPGIGAIASSTAAALYGLEILAAGVETNKKNFTRFLCIYKPNGNRYYEEKEAVKASLSFSLPHKTGSLSQVLSIFSFYGINLTKIQSIPILGQEFQYHFLIDLRFEELQRYRQALEAIRPLTEELQILGEYKRGKKVMS